MGRTGTETTKLNIITDERGNRFVVGKCVTCCRESKVHVGDLSEEEIIRRLQMTAVNDRGLSCDSWHLQSGTAWEAYDWRKPEERGEKE
jgi:hypothetical protein